MASLATKYWQFLVCQGLLCGLGSGMIFCPVLALNSTYFQKKRSLALGSVASGSATGGIIIPLIVQNLLPRVGLPWTLRALGFVTLFVLSISNLVLRPRLPPRKIGSWVDLAAFKEPQYVLFATGMFLVCPPNTRRRVWQADRSRTSLGFILPSFTSRPSPKIFLARRRTRPLLF